MMYLPDDADNDAIDVFATKAGAPSNPDWYYNLTAAGEGTVERGTETYPVTVRELQGDERDPHLRRAGARRYPGFADYAKSTAWSERSRCWSRSAPPDIHWAVSRATGSCRGASCPAGAYAREFPWGSRDPRPR